MDLSQYVVLGAVLVGVTELLNRARARDWWVVATIVSCVVVGAVCGAFKVFGTPSVETGILVGFAASGALKTVSMLGQKSTPTPSSVIEPVKR
jgi:hydrogenase/urease accessory protein HupE